MNDDFKPINTQEELDKIIKERLTRKEESIRKEYEGYISQEDYSNQLASKDKEINDFKAKLEKNNTEIEDYKGKLKKYETDSVKTGLAMKYNIPYEFRNRIQGTNAEEMEQDAEMLSKFISKSKSVSFEATTEPQGAGSSKEMAERNQLRALLKGKN